MFLTPAAQYSYLLCFRHVSQGGTSDNEKLPEIQKSRDETEEAGGSSV